LDCFRNVLVDFQLSDDAGGFAEVAANRFANVICDCFALSFDESKKSVWAIDGAAVVLPDRSQSNPPANNNLILIE